MINASVIFQSAVRADIESARRPSGGGNRGEEIEVVRGVLDTHSEIASLVAGGAIAFPVTRCIGESRNFSIGRDDWRWEGDVRNVFCEAAMAGSVVGTSGWDFGSHSD